MNLAQHITLLKATEYIQIQVLFFGNPSTNEFIKKFREYLEIADDNGCLFQHVEELKGGLINMFFMTDSKLHADTCVTDFWVVDGVLGVGQCFISNGEEDGRAIFHKTTTSMIEPEHTMKEKYDNDQH